MRDGMTNKKAIDIVDGLRMAYICDPNECRLTMYDKDNEACKACDEHHDALAMAVEALKEVERHNETFEWCTDCKEYDTENHCCHRWTKRIRNTVEEMKSLRWNDEN